MMRIKVLEWYLLWMVLVIAICGISKQVFDVPYWMSVSELLLMSLASFRLASSVIYAWTGYAVDRQMARQVAAAGKKAESNAQD